MFVKGRTSLTNLICLKGLTKYADERSAVDIIHLEFKKAVDKVPHQRQVKIPWYWNQHNKLDRAMAYRHETKGRSGRIRSKCEIHFEWSTTGMYMYTSVYIFVSIIQ